MCLLVRIEEKWPSLLGTLPDLGRWRQYSFLFVPFKNYFVFHVYGCFAWVCVYKLIPGGPGVQKRTSDPLEFQMVVICRVGAGNQTCLLWNSRQCSSPLSHLSSSRDTVLQDWRRPQLHGLTHCGSSVWSFLPRDKERMFLLRQSSCFSKKN